MITKLKSIHQKFGKQALLRTLLVGIGMLVMGIAGVYAFGRMDILAIPFVLTWIGYLLRKQIAKQVEKLPAAFNAGLFIYGVVLLLGARIGVENEWKLFIITITTALVFNLQYWALSDSDVYNPANPSVR